MVSGLKSVRHRRDDALSRVGWVQLERLMARHYQREGYAVEHVGTGGPLQRFDGGIDLKLHKGSAYLGSRGRSPAVPVQLERHGHGSRGGGSWPAG